MNEWTDNVNLEWWTREKMKNLEHKNHEDDDDKDSKKKIFSQTQTHVPIT